MKNFKNLNFGASEVLERSQMKSVLGSGITLRNVKASNTIMMYNGGVYACQCTWDVNMGDGNGWQSTSGPCPGGFENSCLPQ